MTSSKLSPLSRLLLYEVTAAPAALLPPCATSSFVNLSVVEDSGFVKTGDGETFWNPAPSHYQDQQGQYKESSPYWQE